MSQKKMKTMDGNNAAAYVSYAFTEVAAIYPITPSSVMAEVTDEWAANGKKNLFGQEVKVVEMQSEGGAAGAVHGSLASGALTTTYTASQGLLLMIPNMYKIAVESLPTVFHVSARALSYHTLSIFGDHSDVMATRQTGFSMLSSASVQEVMDLASVAHLSAIKGSAAILHFFDGFRTSHEIQKIELIDYEVLDKLLDRDAVKAFRERSLAPSHPKTIGTAQNPDVYFQGREATNKHYEQIPEIVQYYMDKIGEETGRHYHLFDYVGAPDAEYVVVAMGSVCETIHETVNKLVSEGKKVGAIKVRLYRPFSAEHFIAAVPKTCKKIAVLDRTKESGAAGEPLYLDVRGVLYDVEDAPKVYGGRYGLASKDTTPAQIAAVFENLASDAPKNNFTIGIIDDVTYTSLTPVEGFDSAPEGNISCKFWGLGSDGTVGANKMAIKIIGDNTDQYAQGYFEYDSKKSGGITISHLRFGKNEIKSTYFISNADFVACHNPAYVHQYDMLADLKQNGTFVLNCIWSPEELEENLPGSMKRELAAKNANFYIINAVKIGEDIGLGNRINMIMQSAFFALSKVIPLDEAIAHLKDQVVANYGFMGDDIVAMNYKAIEMGSTAFTKVEIPASWADAPLETEEENDDPEFIKNVLRPISKQQGNKLPVSLFANDMNGKLPAGTAAYEKRGVATNVPQWNKDTCIQCNQCSFVCPHATIRPILVKKDAERPADFETVQAKGKGLEGYDYRIQISPLDCMGCGVCVDVCPSKTKSLTMKPIASQLDQTENWKFAAGESKKKLGIPADSVKNSQFNTPYFEFSGACAGCGETPYAKLVTQLFGENMIIANATGCSSIWGASYPSSPYTVDANGRGPAWGNSLFEDNAEFGLGMATAAKQVRAKVKKCAEDLAKEDISADLRLALDEYIVTFDDREKNTVAANNMLSALESAPLEGIQAALAKEILDRHEFADKRSVWIFGGDGWAYDIGYGGLDHVLASGENVNVLVFDTEVYSNTGGQSSKATPAAAIAMFAASGKKVKKKDLGLIAMGYGYVYVAQVAMGADRNQLLKAMREAEAYDGPSIIIAYAPCINHGIKAGMNKSQSVMKDAVDAGYWHLYRYNPDLKKEGKNPFILDSKEPKADFRQFLMSEVRYAQLTTAFPDTAEDLFEKAEEDAKNRYHTYKRMADQEEAIF
ncbi:MAG: pyruvate:ferredoxin (flavodoxin) oxidoreductase [Firmicutes bacterium]|nr:pyruvate:ferredoxin (flavodoxin) oxidoreductase [Bacillota bacterium]MDD7733925.1 pyruvate:ferredoxin (flavodoxin) oxidoreductase [Bacillota bacterium]